jgi:hypothetical protein
MTKVTTERVTKNKNNRIKARSYQNKITQQKNTDDDEVHSPDRQT